MDQTKVRMIVALDPRPISLFYCIFFVCNLFLFFPAKKKGGVAEGYYSMATAKSKSPKKGMTMRIGKDSRHS